MLPLLPLLPAAAAALAAAGAATRVPPADVSQTVGYFSQAMIHIEAENFTAARGSAWVPKGWGDDGGLFASTVANTFHSRRGYLHAPANASAETVATAVFTVAAAGSYQVLARYETGYRFNQPFRLDIAAGAGAAPLYTRTYGYRDSPKAQAFGGCPTAVGQAAGRGQLQAECSWPYGTTENIVWEGTDGAPVALAAGSYVMTLTAVNSTAAGAAGAKEPGAALFCNRNVDVIVLTPNTTDVQLRLLHEAPFLPLDGLMSQGGEVFFKVENTGDAEFNLTVPYTYIHSPYFGMHLVLPVSTAPGGACGPLTRLGQCQSGPMRCSDRTSQTAPCCLLYGVLDLTHTHITRTDLTVKPSSGCSRAGGPLCPTISTPAKSSSAWVDVGALADTFNHGTWNLPFGPYVLHVGVRSGGTAAAPLVTEIGEFDAPNDTFGLQLVFDASTRATHRVRHQVRAPQL
jgi:hypothetical protein